jgi:two-component sensor histidine kinase
MTDADQRRVGSVVVLTDLSEYRSREAALRDEVRRLGLLLKETHHRVKNNLQIIASLVAILAASEEEAPPWVDSLEQRVRAIAMVHETLYESSNYGEVNLNDYIRRMVDNSLAQAGLSASVHVSIDVASGRLSLGETIPVGIIVSEFLTNSVKYACAGRSEGRLTIRESEGPDEVVELFYADDGPGISPERRENPRQGSVGMEIVEALVGQLGGELVLGDPPGFSATLTFPRNRPPRG